MGEATTIYRSAGAEAELLALYDRMLGAWPVPHRVIDVPVRYGRVRVIESGPESGTPLLLLHASSMSAVSWAPNVGALSDAGFRSYAVDHIGEAGRSVLDSPREFPKKAAEVGRLYADVADGLGISRCSVLGASIGGHSAMRFALHAPERVSKLVLLGPMGISPLGPSAVVRMMTVSMWPTPARVRRTAHWALGTDASVQAGYGEWFETVLRSVASPPRVARPVALRPEEMRRLPMPVLLILGDRDNLVGDASRAARRAASLPGVRVEVMRSAHLIGVERAADVNAMVVAFLAG